jgi:molybdate transport system ATP-binding protein
LFPHLSALENVAFGLRARGVARAEARTRARAWLERLGVGARADARPAALSGGEAQRVALARALAIAPRLLLLDEPLAALDARSALEVRRELARELASFEGVRLLVTHDPLEAMTLAQRLVVLEGGRVVQSGTPDAIARHPRSAYIAEFVGVNLYRGRAKADRVTLASGAVLAFAGAAEGDVFAVLHPRAVALHAGRPEGSPRNVWSGTVEGIDVAGQHARVRVTGALPVVAEVTPAAVAELGLAPGRTVWVSCKAMEVAVYGANPV